MKNRIILPIVALVAFAVVSCCGDRKPKTVAANEDVAGETKQISEVVFEDYGAEPFVFDIDEYTTRNDNYRTTLWTGDNIQVTLMSIPVGGDVGLEMHEGIDQFLRIEEGVARVEFGKTKDKMDSVIPAEADFAIIVPSGTWHNIINTGDKPLKIYSIYGPTEVPFGTVHKTQKEAIEAEAHH